MAKLFLGESRGEWGQGDRGSGTAGTASVTVKG